MKLFQEIQELYDIKLEYLIEYHISDALHSFTKNNNKFHFNFIKKQTHMIDNCPYNIQDIKYIFKYIDIKYIFTVGSHLGSTAANGIEPTLVR